MAKKFNKVIKTAKSKVYGSQDNILTVLASANSQVNFSPALKPGQVMGSTPDVNYQVQRPKRVKGKEITTSHSPGTTSDGLAILDGFSGADWETVEFGTGKLKVVGVKMGLNEEFDADDLGETHARSLATAVQSIAPTRLEGLLEKIDADIASWTTLAKTDLRGQIQTLRLAIQLLVDDYKHFSDNQVVFLHPLLVHLIEKEIGQEFRNEAPIYGTTFTSQFSVGGTPVVPLPSLNKYDGEDNLNIFAGFIMDVEALAFKADPVKAMIDNKIALTRYVGQAFYDIFGIVDKARITKLQMAKSDLPTLATSKKVNA